MLNEIEKIIMSEELTSEEKYAALNHIEKEIEIARNIIDGRLTYCTKCKNWYLTESFLIKKRTQFTFGTLFPKDDLDSPASKSETYLVCPKGHEEKIQDKELEKKYKQGGPY